VQMREIGTDARTEFCERGGSAPSPRIGVWIANGRAGFCERGRLKLTDSRALQKAPPVHWSIWTPFIALRAHNNRTAMAQRQHLDGTAAPAIGGKNNIHSQKRLQASGYAIPTRKSSVQEKARPPLRRAWERVRVAAGLPP